MCKKSRKIQKTWNPAEGDKFIFKNEIGVVYIIAEGRIPDKDNIKEGIGKVFYLPTQEQLQKMSGLPWWDFDQRCNEIRRVSLEDPMSDFEIGTKEEAGICVVMEKYNKFWNGKEWK